MYKVENFQIDDIDGCEFVISNTVGKMIISFHQDYDNNYTGLIEAVYSDGSRRGLTAYQAQNLLDEGEWMVLRYER